MDLNAVVLAITQGLSSPDATIRARSADEVTDLVREYSPDQASDLAGRLAGARIAETDPTAQEAQMNALAELAEWHQLPETVVVSLDQIPVETLTDEQGDYLAYIRQPS